MPKVSVIITTYNSANTLTDCLNGALKQTFRDYEILVVDNGSTDNTYEVVSAYPVRYHFQENRGLTAGLNKGIELTNSQYIAFLDSNDILTEEAIEKRVKMLDKHPEVGFCYSQANFMNNSGSVKWLKKSSFLNNSAIVSGRDQIKELLLTNRIALSTVMARRTCFDKAVGKLDERFKYFGDDLLMFIRLAKAYPVAYIDEPLVMAEGEGRSGYGKVYVKDAEIVWQLALQEVFEDPELKSYFQRYKKRAFSTAYKKSAGYVYAYGKNMALTRHYLWKAFKVYPKGFLQKDVFSTVYMFIMALLPNRLMAGVRKIKTNFLDTTEYSRRFEHD